MAIRYRVPACWGEGASVIYVLSSGQGRGEGEEREAEARDAASPGEVATDRAEADDPDLAA